MYEGISPRAGRPGAGNVSPGVGNVSPGVNGDSSATANQQLYMGIDPRTRDSVEKAQYMGLKDARSS